jgi:hypothetical protein
MWSAREVERIFVEGSARSSATLSWRPLPGLPNIAQVLG